MENETLHVIAVISNPVRYESRYRLYNEFKQHVEGSKQAKLYTVEAAYGSRPFAITDADKSHHFQFRTKHELWHKENLINLGVARLPPDWKYMAWVDADVKFVRDDWAHETIQQLQHYRVVQMFSHAVDLDHWYKPLATWQSFSHRYLHSLRTGTQPTPNRGYVWHPGFAWAIRRETLEALGGLMDFCVVGSADHHMAMSFGGILSLAEPGLAGYNRKLKEWHDRAQVAVDGDLGCVDGMLTHGWHGRKRDRRYIDRRKILNAAKFDPDADLKTESSGLLALEGSNKVLRDGLRAYFRARNEDSIDVE